MRQVQHISYTVVSLLSEILVELCNFPCKTVIQDHLKIEIAGMNLHLWTFFLSGSKHGELLSVGALLSIQQLPTFAHVMQCVMRLIIFRSDSLDRKVSDANAADSFVYVQVRRGAACHSRVLSDDHGHALKQFYAITCSYSHKL